MHAELAGTRPQRVIDSLLARRSAADPARARDDGRKIALVFEGGGMRGVCSGGGAVALDHLGLPSMFDAVYATSAGVMNASYLLSGQAKLGIRIYYEDLTRRRFINPFRLWKIMDMDYVFDEVVKRSKPLDVPRLLSSHADFYVAMMDMNQAESHLVDVKRSKSDVLQTLKAATAMQVLYNRAVLVENRHCMDGGLLIPFPIHQAIADGCTDLLVLLTNPLVFVEPAPRWHTRWLFNRFCTRSSRPVRKIFADQHLPGAIARDLATGRVQPVGDVNIACFGVDAAERVHRTTMDPVALREAGTRYGRALLAAFGADPGDWELPPIGGSR